MTSQPSVRLVCELRRGETIDVTQIQGDAMSCGEQQAIWDKRAYRNMLLLPALPCPTQTRDVTVDD